jgi:N utilization substance protein B
MTRRKGRTLALEALYAWEAAGTSLEELIKFPWLDEEKLKDLDEESLSYPRLLIAGVIENQTIIDSKIRAAIQNWDFSRLKRVDLAILRLSAYSLLFQKDTPSPVTIEEAIKLSQEYSGEDSYRFINAILDTISHVTVNSEQ